MIIAVPQARRELTLRVGHVVLGWFVLMLGGSLLGTFVQYPVVFYLAVAGPVVLFLAAYLLAATFRGFVRDLVGYPWGIAAPSNLSRVRGRDGCAGPQECLAAGIRSAGRCGRLLHWGDGPAGCAGLVFWGTAGQSRVRPVECLGLAGSGRRAGHWRGRPAHAIRSGHDGPHARLPHEPRACVRSAARVHPPPDWAHTGLVFVEETGIVRRAHPAGDVLITDDIAAAREQIAAADFFQTAFGSAATTDLRQEELHEQVLARLRAELFSWADEPVVPNAQAGA